MTEKIKFLLNTLTGREYKKFRRTGLSVNTDRYKEIDRQAQVFRDFVAMEQPVLFEHDSFGFHRSTDITQPRRDGNITPNYQRILSKGFDRIILEIRQSIASAKDPDKRQYGESMLEQLSIGLEMVDKYKRYAKETGHTILSEALCRVPYKAPRSFYEALLSIKICIYMLRLYGATHLTLGRFDQYMYPYYIADKQKGISQEQLFEILEEFFISLNYDTDLYFGVQQGDNGQSMALGGFDEHGNSVYNELSEMCIKASLELSVIDPKINLRVGKNTPDALYELGTKLTKRGLGFPQYCNDDVVVPGLIRLGYDPKDAVNYTVAACWEFIIPDCAADFPNICTMDFPKVVNDAIADHLKDSPDFDALMRHVKTYIETECDNLVNSVKGREFPLMPLLSIFVDGCIETLTDMWQNGCKYHNYGCHGAGIANATDALSAVKKTIYDKKNISKQQLLDALQSNFDGYTDLRTSLLNSPKMGNNDDYADDIAHALMDIFANNMNGRPNGNGGIWRAGTGSAMEYVRKGEKCPATADGRYAAAYYSSSFSPSLTAKTQGILSVIQSFSKYDMTNIINGGPLTIELDDTVFRNDMGIQKTAMLVKNFIMLGGHQLQLNALNRERLLDAQMHPEKHRDLITRVWGWSGYFTELDEKYQNHILSRTAYLH